MNTLFRALPSVDACLTALAGGDLPHSQVRALVRLFWTSAGPIFGPDASTTSTP